MLEEHYIILKIEIQDLNLSNQIFNKLVKQNV